MLPVGAAMSIVVFGAGYLGRLLAQRLEGATLVGDVDVTDGARVREVLRALRPSFALNAAGKTGRPNVDWCERFPAETMRSNALGALSVAEACAREGVRLVHLGSGCVFSGPAPREEGWSEEDTPDPRSLYARSKYAADLALSALPGVAILRLRMPFGGEPSPRNLLTKLAGYEEVVDVRCSVTSVDDLVTATRGVLAAEATGIFHVVNRGGLSLRRAMERFRERVDPTLRTRFITEEELYRRGLVKAPRSHCVLASSRLDALGVRLRTAEEALEAALEQYARQLQK